MAPSVSKARTSANKIFGIIEKDSKIDVRKEIGGKVFENGDIDFNKVYFSYPSKKNKKVLKNVNMVFP